MIRFMDIQRRMSFAVMEDLKRKRINVDITEGEAAVVDKVLPQVTE